MKYFIRSVKYFFYFAFLTTAIILVLVFIGAVEGDINTIFEGGYSSLWKIAIFFALVAAVYPKFGFVCRKLDTTGSWDDVRNAAVPYFSGKPFKLESETDDAVSFRRRDIIARISKMGEDRITVRKTEDGFAMEGLRKDVITFATGLEYRLPPHNEDQA
jgi:hypothetical protein